MTSFDIKGKMALITGGSRGIGYAIAEKFVESGANVIIASRTQKDLDKAADTLSRDGGNVFPISVHAGKNDSIQSMVKQSIQQFGGIDIVVNNAATNPHYGPIFTSEDSHWDKIWDVNVKGYYKVAKACVPSMTERGGGKIINIASIFGVVSKAKRATYSTTKWGLIGLTKAIAHDLAPHNILVNAVSPGFVNTELTRRILGEKEIENLVDTIPQKRLADAKEIAKTVVFLASDLNTYITGQNIIVDGGFTSA